MIVPMFAIYDVKVRVFGPPYCVHSEEYAIRAFRDVVLRPGNVYFEHPEDYVLYSVGSYDDDAGVLIGNETPVSIITGLQLKNKE